MPWALLLFLVPLALFLVAARRLVRVMQQLRDPRRLAELLSEATRRALLEAGLDLDSIRLEELQKSEELSRLVGADLQRALRAAVLGGGLPETRRSVAALRPPAIGEPGVSALPSRFPESQPAPFLPPPIDSPRGSGPRILLVLVIVGLSAAAILVLGLR
jgi:hypothetical protein